MAYGSMTSATPEKKAPAKKAPTTTKKSGGLTDKQKQQLKSHMDKHKDKMTPSQMKSHRMKMMVRMRKGMSIAKAHAEIMK